MATSGTVGRTVFETRKIVDRAYRLARVPSQMVAGEMLQIALDELYLILSSVASTGVPLWCIEPEILPLYYGQTDVPTPVGTVSILQAAIREVTRLPGTAFSSAVSGSNVAELAFDRDIETDCVLAGVDGHIGIMLDNPQAVTNIGILPAATGVWNVVLEYSRDDISYTTFYSNTAFEAVDGQWQWMDFEKLPPATYWRLRAVGGSTVLSVAELVFANNPSEILMGNVSKDDYFNLPNKTFQGKPLQYWQDRQMPPVLKVWPAADLQSTFRQIVIYRHRQIEDVGTLRQTIEMPPRWLNAVSLKLGVALARVTPESTLNQQQVIDLRNDADKAWREAWMEERDPSPITLAPDISMYTR